MASQILPLKDSLLTWGLYIGLMGALAVLCFGSLGDLLLDTHDQDYILDSAAVSRDFSRLLSPDKRMPGRPTLELVLWLGYALGGEDPRNFHLLGVLLHAGASLSLVFVCRRTGLNLELCLLTGLLFLLNVAHFRAVHWISAHCYPLAMICAALAVVRYLAFTASGRLRHLAVFCGLLIVGTLAHITAAIALVFCLYLSWRRGHALRPVLAALLPPGLLLGAIIAALKTFYPGAPQLSILAPNLDLLDAVWTYLWLWSRLLTTAHWLPVRTYQLHSWEIVVGLGCIVLFAVSIWKRLSPLEEWNLWIFLNLLPFLFIAPAHIQTIPAGPSRYLYLASAGSSVVIAWGLQRLCLWLGSFLPSLKAYALAGLLAGLLISSFISLKKSESISVYTSARSYLAAGDPALGIAQLRRAIARGSDVIDLQDAYSRLVLMLMSSGEDVDPALDEALRFSPDGFIFKIYRLVLTSMDPHAPGQQTAQARIDSFKVRISAAGLIAQTYYNLGVGFEQKGDSARAIVAFRRSLEFNSGQVKALRSLAAALFSAGRLQEAEQVYRQVLLRESGRPPE